MSELIPLHGLKHGARSKREKERKKDPDWLNQYKTHSSDVWRSDWPFMIATPEHGQPVSVLTGAACQEGQTQFETYRITLRDNFIIVNQPDIKSTVSISLANFLHS